MNHFAKRAETAGDAVARLVAARNAGVDAAVIEKMAELVAGAGTRLSTHS